MPEITGYGIVDAAIAFAFLAGFVWLISTLED